jgi:hypothetical protein
MAVAKLPARAIIFQVQAADGVTWLAVGGLNDFQADPSANSATADTTTFDSGGNYEQRVMQRGAMITLAGLRLADTVTGTLDAGQARLDFLGVQTGEASAGTARFRFGAADPQWRVWTCTVDPSPLGGKNNDETSWGAKITRSGATTLTTAP